MARAAAAAGAETIDGNADSTSSHGDRCRPARGARLHSALELTEDQFFALCQLNREPWIERNVAGVLEIMSPVSFETGGRE